MTSSEYEADISDFSLSKLLIGTMFGYAAGKAPDEAAAYRIAGTLLAYRVAHEVGFLEVHARRHSSSGSCDNYRPSGGVDFGSGSNEGGCGRIGQFTSQNALVVTGFISGYVLSRL